MRIRILPKVHEVASEKNLETPFVFGRAEDADVRVTNRWASRHHCEIDEVHGRVVIRDLESTHGTYVNGKKVLDAELFPGDELSIGLAQILLDWSPAIHSTEHAFSDMAESV